MDSTLAVFPTGCELPEHFTKSDCYKLLKQMLASQEIQHIKIGELITCMFARDMGAELFNEILAAYLNRDSRQLEQAVHKLRACWPAIPAQCNDASRAWLQQRS